MSATVQYFFAPNSPWTYLGHLRFWDIARQHGAKRPPTTLAVGMGQIDRQA